MSLDGAGVSLRNMALLLLLLLVVPLLVAPVYTKTPYDNFLIQHTFNGNSFGGCTFEMNRILPLVNKACKPCNSFILGDKKWSTNINDVLQVCGSGGTHVKDNLYKSIKSFRVLKCLKTSHSGNQPPNCDYLDNSIQTQKITLGCDKNGLPVHFDC